MDPETQELLKINQTLSEEKILSKQAQTSIKYIVTGQLHVQVYIYIVTGQLHVQRCGHYSHWKTSCTGRYVHVTGLLHVQLDMYIVTGQLHEQDMDIINGQLH